VTIIIIIIIIITIKIIIITIIIIIIIAILNITLIYPQQQIIKLKQMKARVLDESRGKSKNSKLLPRIILKKRQRGNPIS